MAFKIDYDRGVLKRHEPKSGVEVYMYIDSPGVYLSAHGTEVNPALAQAAGFDTETLGRKRVMNERMEAAMDSIRREMAVGEVKKEVVREDKGFKIINIGMGRHYVEAPDGDRLTANPIPIEQAEVLFDQLVPKETKDVP